MANENSGQSRVLDLIPRERLSKYLKSASSMSGMPIRLMDKAGETIIASGETKGADGCPCPKELWEKAVQAMSGGAVELPCPEGCHLVAAPVRLKDEPLGYLSACRKAEDAGALRMLSMSAAHIEGLSEAGNDVESLSAEVVRVYEELSLIYGLTSRLGSKVDLDQICRVVADEARKVLDPADIMVQLAEGEGGTLRTVFAAGDHREVLLGYTPGTEEGIIGRAFVGHRSVLVCDVNEDRRHAGWPYPIRRLLAVPLVAEGKVLGVISATDKRDGAEFNSREEKLISAITSVAAIAIKNAQLYTEIKGLLEGFINAAVTAVESRDPTTAGHSTRVALMTVELAKKVAASDLPVFKDITFSREQLLEIYYAGLLHDFGKIGVRESVLVKEAKLPQHNLEAIKERFAYIRELKTREALEKKQKLLLDEGTEGYLRASGAIDSDLAGDLATLDKYMKLIEAANDPRVLVTELPELARLNEVAGSFYRDPSGELRPCLTPFEFKDLHVLMGSLNSEERREIEMHVTHSYNFLTKIPWTREFPQIAEIVYTHHERLDGSGYPRGLTADLIPIQAKMMALADIFDALTAWDRPYKKAVPVQKALFILEMEASEGKLEPHLVQIFRDARVYEVARQKPGTPGLGG